MTASVVGSNSNIMSKLDVKSDCTSFNLNANPCNAQVRNTEAGSSCI